MSLLFPTHLFRRQPLPPQLKICLISRRFPIGGRTADQGSLWPIAKGLAKKGHKVVVLAQDTHHRSEDIVRDGVQISYLSDESEFGFARLAKDRFARLHRDEPFHIVHAADSSGYLIGRFKNEFNVSVVFDVAATQMSQLYAIAGMAQETMGSLLRTSIAIAYKFLRTYYGTDRHLIKTADGIFVMSPHERIILERYYLYPDNNIYSVPHGIEIGDLSPKEKSDELKVRLGLPPDAKTIVTISDMTEVMPLTNLFEAFEKVAIKRSNARLIVVGNGPRLKEIEFHMLNLALGSRVIFTGPVKSSEVPDYISLADVYVNISSRTTGFEPSILEAMAQKKVVIGSEVSPLSSLVEDGVDGFLVRPADVKALSHLLIDIFSENVPVLEIGDRARRRVVDLFDFEKLVAETLDAYFKVLGRTKRYKNSKH